MTPGFCSHEAMYLGTEAVESLALTLEGIDDVESGDGLATGMLGVDDGVLDNVLEEGLKNLAGLVIHHTVDALDAATTGQTADSGLRDALDVVAEDLAMTLGATLTTLSASAHDCLLNLKNRSEIDLLTILFQGGLKI